jgi:catechol 2,3-dioxygenase-like lactoylglutathione lyase family enzyme
LGFNEDHDTRFGETSRVVQLTPPGSACSIVIGTGLGEISEMRPGSIKALHLVVADVARTRDELIAAGVEVGEVADHGRGVKMAHFSDPDGNSWALQEMSWRTDVH